jgi:predicted small metal-binding protein
VDRALRADRPRVELGEEIMYVLHCRDLDLVDCEYAYAAQSKHKVRDRFFAHMREEHPELISGITDERHDQITRLMNDRIREETASEAA